MDSRNLTPLLGFGIILTVISVSGVKVPRVDLSVSISDELVLLYWKHPTEDSSNITYNVQMATYTDQWKNVGSCTGISEAYCDLTSYIEDYRRIYKVRVQTVMNKSVSEWTKQKVALYESKLSPPAFNVWVSSSTLTVHVVPKPVLKEIFAFGVIYTIHLEDDGQTVMTFSDLQWGVEYCVRVKVEGKGGVSGSGFSPQYCQRLPVEEWYVIAVASLSTAAVLLVIITMALILVCYLKRPRQTPAALKSLESGWHPLSVAKARMEVVTDKGWFLTSDQTKGDTTCEPPRLPVEKTEGDKEERRSLDSGVCMESNSDGDRRRREDSGCESSASSETVFPLASETHTPEGSYRSQKPASHNNGTLKQIGPLTLLAKVVSGYRSEPQACLCLGAGQCTWCLKQRLSESYRPQKQALHFSKLDTMVAGEAGFGQMGKTFPLLTSLCTQKDLNMNEISLNICDVQLTSD